MKDTGHSGIESQRENKICGNNEKQTDEKYLVNIKNIASEKNKLCEGHFNKN